MDKNLFEMDDTNSQHDPAIFAQNQDDQRRQVTDIKDEKTLRILKMAAFLLCCAVLANFVATLVLVVQQKGEIEALRTSIDSIARQSRQDAKKIWNRWNITDNSVEELVGTVGNFKEFGNKLRVIERTMVPPESCTKSSPEGYQDLEDRTKAFCKDGWTVFQHRFDGSVDFNRTWQEYKLGFGNPNGEFWWGLEKIHEITSNHVCRLHIDMVGFNGTSAHAEYSSFLISGECDNYSLYVSGFSGDAGDSLNMPKYAHNGMQFTTKDRDHDNSTTGNCASAYGARYGAWWHTSCGHAQLNAPWGRSTGIYTKMLWYTWTGWYAPMRESTMMFRCD